MNIPTTARGLWRFIADYRAAWPKELFDLGEVAYLALMNMGHRSFSESSALQRLAARDLQAFATAYAEWKR